LDPGKERKKECRGKPKETGGEIPSIEKIERKTKRKKKTISQNNKGGKGERWGTRRVGGDHGQYKKKDSLE